MISHGICVAYFKLVSEIADPFMEREVTFKVKSYCIGEVCALSYKQQQALQTISGRTWGRRKIYFLEAGQGFPN